MKDLSKYIPGNAAEESKYQRKAIAPAVSYVPAVKDDDVKELDDDFQEVRRRLIAANILAEEAVKEAMELAKNSDHPGAWQVVGELLKGLTKVNEVMVKSHSTRIKAKNPEGEKPPSGPVVKQQTNTQNNFYASPAEMAEMLRKQNEESNG